MNRHTAWWLGLMGGLAAGAAVRAVDDPAERLAAARAALGGDRMLASTTTFVIKGTKRIDTRVAHQSVPFEIDCQLPDKFVWKDASGQGDIVSGFNRNKLITNVPQDLALAVPRQAATSSQELAAVARDADQLMVAKSRFTVVTVALLAASYAGHPLRFEELPAPNGTRPAIGLRAGDGFAATLVFDLRTHLPDRLLYRVDTPEQAQVTEWRYADYKSLEGRLVPGAFTYSSGNDAGHLEQRWSYQLEDVRFNVPIDPTMFQLASRH